jgi:hypothetical protein
MALTDLPNEPQPRQKSPLQTLLPFTTVGLIIAALYVAWTFYSRAEANRQAQERIDAEQVEKRKRVVHQIYGSGGVKFSTFGADNGVLRRGESTHLCYGVVNAKTVKIEPPVGEEVKPTYRHCVDIKPQKTTTYTITATDEKGHNESQAVTIRVQ